MLCPSSPCASLPFCCICGTDHWGWEDWRFCLARCAAGQRNAREDATLLLPGRWRDSGGDHSGAGSAGRDWPVKTYDFFCIPPAMDPWLTVFNLSCLACCDIQVYVCLVSTIAACQIDGQSFWASDGACHCPKHVPTIVSFLYEPVYQSFKHLSHARGALLWNHFALRVWIPWLDLEICSALTLVSTPDVELQFNPGHFNILAESYSRNLRWFLIESMQDFPRLRVKEIGLKHWVWWLFRSCQLWHIRKPCLVRVRRACAT